MIKDPHFEREQDKYENPIPSREYIIEYLRSQLRLFDKQS